MHLHAIAIAGLMSETDGSRWMEKESYFMFNVKAKMISLMDCVIM